MSATRKPSEQKQQPGSSTNQNTLTPSAADRSLQSHLATSPIPVTAITATDADSDLPPDLLAIVTKCINTSVNGTPHTYAKSLKLFGNLSQLYAAEANQAAAALFSNNVQAAEAFIEKNPAILSSVVEVTNTRGQTIVGTLSRLYAEHAAFCLLYGDTVTAENVVKSWIDKTKNPSVLYEVIETTDRRGNKVKGTLLQLAALANDFNPWEQKEEKEDKEDYGMVERLKRYYPKEDADKLLKATRPPGWEKDTAARMKPYEDAFKTLLNGIIAAAKAPNYGALKTACKDLLDTFQTTLAKIPETQDVIETGLIFDPQILVTVLDLFAGKINALGGLWSDKSDLVAICGFGGLEACASACDLQSLRKGPYYVEKGQLPDRSLHFVGGVPVSLSGLGSSFCLDEYGPLAGWGAGVRWAGWLGAWVVADFFQNHVRTKTGAQQQVMPQSDNHPNCQCTIM